jgi:two-component system response regulator AtoC
MSDSISQQKLEASVPSATRRILIVEDEALFAKAVQKRLTKAGFTCDIAGSLKEARAKFDQTTPDLVLLDMRLPDGSGLDFLEALRRDYASDVAVLVLSAYGELEDAVAAMKLKATDYLKKPIDLDELLMNVEKVLDKNAMAQRLEYSRTREAHAVEQVELIGEHPSIATVRQQIERIASLTRQPNAVPPTVLILGETGTGKDVCARLLHSLSGLKDRPFVQLDCASLPKDLIEAELFGHEKGAFTDARAARTGLIEAAEDGVLFMDEVGELPIALQAKLLAVLERRTLRRLGSSQERPTSAWFIAATNRKLEDMVAAAEFRSDLFFRLNVLTLELPPLRDRGNDIALLAQRFVAQTAARYGLEKVRFSKPALTALCEYSWPGNVRELKHIVERAVLLSGGQDIEAEVLMLQAPRPAPSETAMPLEGMTLDEAERYLIEHALERTDGNVSEAARQLGVTRMAMRYRMQKYEL